MYLNKDAIIEDIKEAAIESVLGGMGGGALPIGTPDLAPPTDSAAAPAVPSGGLGVPNF